MANNTLTNLTNTIVTQAALEAFRAALLALTVFAHNVSPDPIVKGDKVKVLSIAAAQAAQNFAGTYASQDSEAEGLDVSINKHKFVGWSLTDKELADKPQLQLEKFGKQKGFQLAKAVLQDVLSLVTVANYGAAAFTGPANTFDLSDVIDLGNTCDEADWDEMGRALVLKSSYHASLRKDSNLSDASKLGTDSVIREGKIPGIDTFEELHKSNLIPGNGENVVGFACLPDAILFAQRYLAPQEGHGYAEAYPITDPETGFTMGFRKWYIRETGEMRSVLECNYGYLKGMGSALKILASA